MKDATYRTTFRRDLKGSDAVHWAEGKVSVSATQVAFDGKMGPGPDYKVYLVRDFVDNKADFLKIKAQAQRIGEVKTFNRFRSRCPRTWTWTTTPRWWCGASASRSSFPPGSTARRAEDRATSR